MLSLTGLLGVAVLSSTAWALVPPPTPSSTAQSDLATATPESGPAIATVTPPAVGSATRADASAASALLPAAIPYVPPTLDWRSCGSSLPSTARCTTLVVPRDWGSARVKGRYAIEVARIRATDPSKRIGVLTFNPGGPGTAAVSNISWVYGLLPTKVRERFDIVAWDPRGVGMSEPSVSGCDAAEATPPATGPVDWAAWVRDYVRAQEETAKECLADNAKHADYIGTWQLVHDLDALREALGEQTLTFWGMSYGTTVGRAYAQYFPTRVRAVLLDGVISPVSTIELWAREHTWDDPAAIDTMLTALGGDYRRKYDTVFATLDRRTLPDGDGGRVTRWSAGRSIIQWASFQTTWGSARYLIDQLYDAVRGRSAQVRTAAAERAGDAIDGAATAKSWFGPQFTYVNCSDMPDRPSVRTLTEIAEAGFAAGGVPVAQAALREGAWCAGLPRLGRPLGQITEPISLRTPPLIANSIADNRTPWTAALEMVAAFPGSGIVRYDGTHHIIYGRTTSCVDEPITRYLTKLKIPRKEVRCPLVWSG